MNFSKSILKKCVLFLLTISVGGWMCYSLTDIGVKGRLKKECMDTDCTCFGNIVDYRLTKKQAKTFLRYLQSRRKRSDTKILEFTTFSDAKEIFDMFAVCQMKLMRDKLTNEGQSGEWINKE